MDIDSQAIEVTKLSLLLKLMEGESQESADSLLKYSDLQLLPDLANNIKCGNSLIGSDFYRDQNMELFDDEQMRKINVFDWRHEFAGIMNGGGFDVVIGNPPYVQLQTFQDQHYRQGLQQAEYRAYHPMGDIYCLFYEKGYDVLRKNGVLGFITSNKWMRAGYGEPLRTFLLEHTAIKQIIDFQGSKIFQHATVVTHIVIYQKRKVSAQHATGCVPQSLTVSAADILDRITRHRFKLAQDKDIFLMISDKEKQLKEKIESAGVPLKEWDIQINYGIKTGYNEAFIIDSKKREELISQDPKSTQIIKPILRGKDIGRYITKWADLWVIFIPWHFPLHNDLTIQGVSAKAEKEFQKNYAVIYEHLSQFKKQLSERNKAETGIRYEWYALQRCAATYYPEFEKEKIVWGNLSTTPRFGYDAGGMFCSAPANLLTGDNLKYILAILNSKLCYYVMRQLAYSREQGYLEYKKIFVEQVVIPQIAHDAQKPFIELVDSMRDTCAKLLNSKTTQDKTLHQKRIDILDAQIDRLVYALYNLNEEEIEVVEDRK